MLGLTKNIGNSSESGQMDEISAVEIKRVLICRPNHRLGNLVLITPLVQEVIETFPNCKIDLFVKGNLAPILFKNYQNINSIIELPKKPFKSFLKYAQGWMSIQKIPYDMVINVVDNSSSGRLSAKFTSAKYKIFGDLNEGTLLKSQEHGHIAKRPVYTFRNYLTKLGFNENSRPVPALDLKLSALEIAQGKQILRTIGNNEQKTICLYTYATGKKCYSASWWEKFYERLKTAYPTYNIIEVLPIENVSKLSFKAPTFYSKDLREIGSLIANADVFISADSGIMHLGSASKTPTVGLFSVTDKEIYQPYGNDSVGIKITTQNITECMNAVSSILKREIIHEQVA